MGTWSRIRNKFTYDNKIRLALSMLGRLGIKITPVLLYAEKADIEKNVHEFYEQKFSDFDNCQLGEEDMQEILKFNRYGITNKVLQERLKRGSKCIAIKKKKELVGFRWYNLNTAQWFNRPLQSNEAYLFDIYVKNKYRGKGLAQYIHYLIVKELLAKGKTKLYSYVAYFNNSAIRFKDKRSAPRVKLLLSINLFNLWKHQLKLKNYDGN